MIPKIIHYTSFGVQKKDENTLDCIDSFKIKCPDFTFKEWNELTFPIEKYPYASKMFNEKRFKEVSEFVSLQVISNEGGVFIDTNILLQESVEPLTVHDCVLVRKPDNSISTHIFGAEKHNPFIEENLKTLSKKTEAATLSEIFEERYQIYPNKNVITFFPTNSFYLFSKDTIKDFHGQVLGPSVIGIYLWGYEWNSWFKKLLRKLKLVHHLS